MASASALTGCAHASSPNSPSNPPPSDQPLPPGDLDGAAAKLRAQYVAQFDADYVDNVVLPSFLNSIFDGQRPVLPMIDVALSKENALPFDMWGLLSMSWKPAPQDGVTVFLQGLDKRGPDNRRKRIYMSAVTPDLYQGKYQTKIVRFFDQLFSAQNANKPLMRIYLDTFWDLYWDLHLGVKGQDIPQQVRQIGENFNTVLAYRDPTQKIVYDNYMAVRKNLDFLKSWIDDRLKDIQSGKTPEPEKTFAWYWLKNGEESEYFNHKDVVFECFHNFVAFSQWGNTLYNIMAKLGRDTGDGQTKDWFTKTMATDYDNPDGSAFPPLERFVMELFRTISPNAGSISAITETRPPAFERHGFIVSPHTSTSHDPVQWPNPDDFDPSRYEHAPTSQDIDEARIQSDGPGELPVRPNVVRRQGRPQSGTAQQRFRHRVRRRRRSSAARVRLRRLRTLRVRLPALPRRAAHHHGLRRSNSEGFQRATSVRQGRRSQPRKGAAGPQHPGGNGADRSHHRHQRRHRIHPPVLDTASTTPRRRARFE